MSTTVNPPEIFKTNRIVGRKPTMDDAQGMFDAYATDPEVTRFLVFKPYEKLEDLQTWLSYIIKEWEKSPGIMYLLYRHNAPDTIVGSFSITVNNFSATLGYLVTKPFWGQGIMTEVVKHWIDWALSQPHIFRIGAFCDVENPASGRVMEKAGMEYEGTLKRYSIHPNLSPEPRDVFSYAKTR